ncbi:uncharacterized protein C17orf113-like [Mobula hypostoma]|uniref:uncharacterized protein C17orf113-like n=1 Tax=Mobula hypostoma TaxID=723540 RepID=UPI002FC2D84C
MLPSSSVGALNELCLLQGPGDLAGQLSACQRRRPVEGFQRAIAAVLEGSVLERVRSLNCYSVLIDVPQDRRARPRLFLYLRVVEGARAAYEPRTYLLSVEEVPGEATAEAIAAAVSRALTRKGLDPRLMCGLALDGTALSAECRDGVEAELRARAPGLLCIRCLAHRLTLSGATAADTVPYLVKYRRVLNSLYAHLAELPRGGGGLEAVEEALGLRDEQSRDSTLPDWLAARAPLEAVLRNFGRLVPLLREGGSAAGAGLAKTLCTYKFLHCSHFLADVLHQLSILGKSYQRPDPDFSIVHPLLKSTVTTVSKPGAGEALKHFLAALPAGACPPDGSFTFRGQVIRDGSRQRAEAEAACAAFLESLTRDLRARFSEAGDADVVTAMTAVFDPAHPPDSKTRHVHTLTGYLSGLGGQGRGEGEHFPMSCRQELVSFLDFVESRPGVRALGSVGDVCRLALGQRLTFPLVGSLAERFLSLPTPSDQLGLLFGRQRALRDRLGGSLSAEALDNLLRIAVHGPPIREFDFKAALQQLKLQEK